MADTTRPRCNLFPPCRAEDKGRCTALRNSDFKGKTCPFYKERANKSGKEAFTDGW